MKLVYLIFKNYRGVFMITSLAGLLSGGANIGLLAILSRNIADYRGGSDVHYTLTTFILVAVAAGLLSLVSGFLNLFVSTRLNHELQLNMVNQIMALDQRRREEVGDGRLIATFTNDIGAITKAVLTIPTLFINTGMTLGGLTYLGLLSPQMMAILFGFLLFCVVSYLVPERKQIELTEQTREAVNRLMERFSAINYGSKELKLHYARSEAMFHNEILDSADELKHIARRRGILAALIRNWLRLMYFVFIAIMLYLMPKYGEVNAVTLVGYALVVMFIQGPVMALIGSRATFRDAAIAFGKTREIGLKLEAGVSVDPFADKDERLAQIAALPAFEHLELRGVTHTYHREDEERPFTMGPIDLELTAGECLFIVGGNGSGKTTLAKLLVGLYAPEQGEIRLNGTAVTEETRLYYRQNFSAIFSDFYIFETLLGLEPGTQGERVKQYLKDLRIDHKVTIDETGKLSTTHLSTGQRKRLALLTAFLEDRDVYLFDEWAADQDPEFKEVFYYQILADLKQRGKTVLVISHDDRYFKVADRVIKLADGQLESIPSPIQEAKV